MSTPSAKHSFACMSFDLIVLVPGNMPARHIELLRCYQLRTATTAGTMSVYDVQHDQGRA